MDARGGKCHQIWRGHRAIFEFFLKLPTTVEELKRGVPAKKETMKKHDLAFAERSPNGARLKRRKRHPLGAGEHAAELG